MSKLSEMQAKLRKGPNILGHIKFHERLKKHVLELAEELDKVKAENEELKNGAIKANWHWGRDSQKPKAIINYYGTAFAYAANEEEAKKIVRHHQLACNFYRLRISELDPNEDKLEAWQIDKFTQFVVSTIKYEEICAEVRKLREKEKIFGRAMDALNEIAPSTYDDVMDAISTADKQTNEQRDS